MDGVLLAVVLVDEVPPVAADPPDGVEEVELADDVVVDLVVDVELVVGGTAAPTVGTVNGGAPVVPLPAVPPPPQAVIPSAAATATAAATDFRRLPVLPVIEPAI